VSHFDCGCNPVIAGLPRGPNPNEAACVPRHENQAPITATATAKKRTVAIIALRTIRPPIRIPSFGPAGIIAARAALANGLAMVGAIANNHWVRSLLLLRTGNVGQHRIPSVLLLMDERGGFISEH
jgi:hypothetical protein